MNLDISSIGMINKFQTDMKHNILLIWRLLNTNKPDYVDFYNARACARRLLAYNRRFFSHFVEKPGAP